MLAALAADSQAIIVGLYLKVAALPSIQTFTAKGKLSRLVPDPHLGIAGNDKVGVGLPSLSVNVNACHNCLLQCVQSARMVFR